MFNKLDTTPISHSWRKRIGLYGRELEATQAIEIDYLYDDRGYS